MNESQNKEIENAVEVLSRLVNNMSFDYDEAAKVAASKFIREHRTLQQSMVRLMAAFIKAVAEANPGSDMRNESAIKWVKEVAEKDSYFPFV
jgi:hypothetical protein